MDTNKTGYYQFKLTLEQFRQGFTIGLTFEGIGVSFNVSDYRLYADYYMLLQLHDVEVSNNTYGLDSTCYLWGYYHLIHLAIVVALLAMVI